MFKIYFKEINHGRLQPIQYLNYSLLLMAFVIGFFICIIVAIGAGEHLVAAGHSSLVA